jgi:Na+/H+ antiporter NhaD/arsenite permease-like protein
MLDLETELFLLALFICIVTLVNLGILGISVKIYSEYLKDKQFESRAKRLGGPKV